MHRIALALLCAVTAAAPVAASDTHHDVVAGKHDHVHGAQCGHAAVTHADHTDYVHDGHLHHQHGDHADEHGAAPAK